MAIHWKEYSGRPIRVTDKERSRSDGGWTIVVRPQHSGLIMVAVVNLKTGKTFGPKVPFVDDRSEIQEAPRQELRILSKMGGLGGNMADASRFRQAITKEAAGTGHVIFQNAVDYRKFVKIKSKLKKAGDEQSYKLMNDIMSYFIRRFDLDSSEESAWYRLINMVRDGDRWDEALLRNNVFKIANSLKTNLPSHMFASDLSAQWGRTVRKASSILPANAIAIKISVDELGNFEWSVRSNLPTSGGHYRIFAQGAAPTPEAAFSKARSVTKKFDW